MNEVPKGCKTFNLQEALTGKTVQTRDGRPVKIAGFNPEAEPTFEIVGWAGKVALSWSIDGQYHGIKNSDADLFMATEYKDVWVVLWHGNGFDDIRSTAYTNEESAKMAAQSVKNGGGIIYGIHKITIEI